MHVDHRTKWSMASSRKLLVFQRVHLHWYHHWYSIHVQLSMIRSLFLAIFPSNCSKHYPTATFTILIFSIIYVKLCTYYIYTYFFESASIIFLEHIPKSQPTNPRGGLRCPVVQFQCPKPVEVAWTEGDDVGVFIDNYCCNVTWRSCLTKLMIMITLISFTRLIML